MTPDDLMVEEIRDWVGSEPDRATIMAASERFAGQDNMARRTALSILERRLADIDSDSSQFAVAGDYSEGVNRASVIKVLQARIARLQGLIGIDSSSLPSVTTAHLAGPGNHR